MKNPFKVFSFRYTFFFSFLFFSLLLIGVIGAASYTITTQETVKQMIASRKLLLGEINKQLVNQMQVIENDSLALSSNPKIIHYLNGAGEPYERVQQKRDILDQISRLSYIKEGVHSVELYSRTIESTERFGTNALYNYAEFEENDLYSQTKNADYSWLGAHEARTGTDEPDNRVISFVRKVTAISGKEVGVLVVNMKLAYVNKLLSGQLPDDSRYVIDSSGRLITEVVSGDENSFANGDANARITRILSEANPDRFAVFSSGRKMLLIWDKQPNSSWIVADSIAWNNVTQASRKIKNVILLAAVACTALAIGMAWLLSRQFGAPIRRLIQDVSRIKSGRLDIRIRNDYQNEFGTLNDSIDLMIRRIRDLLAEVNEQNRRKREAELQMLQEQINPHFIYNTLDMINWRAIERGASDISRMLSLLGKMLRLGLSKGAAFIPIGSELEYLGYYSKLQSIHFGPKVRIDIRIPESLHPYMVPKLLLQPFIENSLIHGIDRATGGTIVVTAEEKDADIRFRLTDDGKGIDAGERYDQKALNGSGIQNVRERIRLYFGDPYGVEIDSRPDRGTVIDIRIPKVSREYPQWKAEAKEA
ncbi:MULTISPECIES: cache domain-containing sensor histidine kinase [Cohnella]|uniref:cache domain-containing sensor histidine kinase n=1 Tax=Cohnella TaxID=329857 RepID=UPI001594B7F0|nr:MULTISPECIES: sensor histidine kinase [Cohnella]MBN2982436.1 sensor histidine kinase [Cohnella algarum]